MSSEHAKNIIPLYERHAVEFDAQRGRSLMERDWLDKFLGLLQPGANVLDLGCGMGEPLARYIIERGFHVTGVDSSDAMAGFCRDRFPEQTWITGDMRQLALQQSFAGILAWNSFFHLTPDDQRAMFAVFARHSADAAALMFTSGPSSGEAIGNFEGEPLYHASLDPDEYRSLLRANGFKVVEHVTKDPTCSYHTVWLARRS